MDDNSGSMPAFTLTVGKLSNADLRDRYAWYVRRMAGRGFRVAPLLALAAQHQDLNADHRAHSDEDHVSAYAALGHDEARTLAALAAAALVLCGFSPDDIGDEGLKDGFPVPSFLMARLATPVLFNDGDAAVTERLINALEASERGYLLCSLTACLHTLGFTPEGMRNLPHRDSEDSQ